MKRIDIHMHTNISDGSDSLEEIIIRVREAGLDLFSVTDHDAIKAGTDLPLLYAKCAPEERLPYIRGVEFSCKDEQGKYHILGYGYDPEVPGIGEVVREGHELRMKKTSARLEFLKEEFGFEFPEEEITELLSRDNPGKPHIAAVDDLERIIDTFTDMKLRDMIRLDFSVVSDVNYYNGIVFNGFIRGIPDCVISGGQYDRLMQKMKRKSGAIGFGVYMDRLERLLEETQEYDIDVLLLYDEDADIHDLNDAVRTMTKAGQTVLAQRRIPEKLRYRTLMRLEGGEVTPIEADA